MSRTKTEKEQTLSLSSPACILFGRLAEELNNAQESASRGEDWQAYVLYHNCLTYLSSIEIVYGENISTFCCPKNACETVMRWCNADPEMHDEKSCSSSQLRKALIRKLNHLRKDRRLDDRIKAAESSNLEGIGGGADEDITFACSCIKLPGDPKDRICQIWFDDIIGLDDAKQRVKEGFIYPLKYINLYGKVATGLLLYGPPGTGKTLMATAMINELEDAIRGSNGEKCTRFLYFAPTTDMLKGKFVGETEKKITQLFIGASKLACQLEKHLKGEVATTSVIFIDEVDGLAPSRDVQGSGQQIVASAVNTLLQMMDGVNAPPNVVVIAATNWPQSLDSAFLRRFSYQVPIDLPTEDEVVELINLLISKQVSEKNFRQFSDARKGVSVHCDRYETTTDSKNPNACLQAVLNSKGCSRSTNIKPLDWTKREYIRTNISEKLPKESIKAIARQCISKHYSNADVTKMVNTAIKISANHAYMCKRFYKYDTGLPELGELFFSINSFPRTSVMSTRLEDMVLINPPDISKSFKQVIEMTNVISFTERTFPNVLGDELYVKKGKKGGYYSFMVQYNIQYLYRATEETVIQKDGFLWIRFGEVQLSMAEITKGGITWWDWIIGRRSVKDLQKMIQLRGKKERRWFNMGDYPILAILFQEKKSDKIYACDVYGVTGDNIARFKDYDTPNEFIETLEITDNIITTTKTKFIPVEVKNETDIFKYLLGEDANPTEAPRDDVIVPYVSGDFFGYSKVVEDTGNCLQLLQRNSLYVNYDFSIIHFQRALEITPSSFKKEEYDKFTSWRDKMK